MERPRRRIPLWLKIAYTAFVCVVVPFYWQEYGPANFLYFCDIALFVTVPAIWIESPLLFCMQAIAIVVPQTIWLLDVGIGLIRGSPPLGFTAYMFDPNIPLFVRGLSTFHGWLPILLLYGLKRLGYDQRAFFAQVIFGQAILLICYFFTAAPPQTRPAMPVNVNYVYGLSHTSPQTWMHPYLWLAMLMVIGPLVMYLPVHLLLRKVFRRV